MQKNNKQREIKFRQFCNIEDNGMHYFTLSEGGYVKDGGWSDVMQYTGLKDKNGKEIYEGDILLIKNAYCFVDGYLTKGFPKSIDAIFQVIFENGAYEYKKIQVVEEREAPYRGINCLREQANSDLEVIGNIYENSELLNESEALKHKK